MEGFLQSYQLGQQLGKTEQLRDLNQQYQLGNPQEQQATLGQIAQHNPQQAQFLQQQQVAQQAKQQKTLQRAGKLAQTVMKADPKQRNSVYKASLKVAGDYGMDVSQLPQEYDDEAAEQLQAIIGMTTEQEKYSAQSPIGKIEQDYRKGALPEQAYKGAIKKATTSTSPVSISMGAEKAEAAGLAGVRVKSFEKTQNQAQAAEQQNQMLASMEQALQDEDAYTGAGGNLVNEAKILAESLGIPTKGIENEAIIRSTGNKLALQMRSPDSGMGMPGAMSDPDRRFLVASVPGNTKTRGQNIAMIGMSKKLNNRKIELARLQEDYLESQGTLRGFERHKKNFVNSHPLFSKEEKVSYKQQLSGKEETSKVTEKNPLGLVL